MTATTSRPTHAQYVRPWLYPAQQRAIFNASRYGIVEASSKSGKTAGCLVWLSEQAITGKAGRNYWWVAPTFAQARMAFRRLKRALPVMLYTANESELTLTLANGALIWFKSGENPDSLYGEDVYAAVIDEATRVREESWHAVRSTLTATRGPLRIIGNVKGRKNWAYQLARRAEAGEPDMHYARLTAYDAVEAGVLSAEEVEDAKRTLPEPVFRELYLAEPSDDSGNPFGVAAVNACIVPLSDAAPVAFGWDVARATDYTVGIGLDAEGKVCRVTRFQQPWAETIAEIVRVTDGVPAMVDATGVGDAVTDALQRAAPDVFEGFTFTAKSKQQLMESLAIAINERQIGYPEGVIAAELRDFEYVYSRTGVKYAAPSGLHDDAVCALALAWRCYRNGPRALQFVEIDLFG